MEAVLFVGLQGAGKSSLYKERFFLSHVRINLDMLKTRHRQRVLIDACHAAKQRYVVDNTHATREERGQLIRTAQAAGFRVVGYYFDVTVDEALQGNAARPEPQRVPPIAIFSTRKRLEQPLLSEGFDALYRVRRAQSGFHIIEVAGEGEGEAAKVESGGR